MSASNWKAFCLACGVVLWGAPGVRAQEAAETPSGEPAATQPEEVRVRIIWVSGSLVRVDLGAESGLQAGDRIRFEPLGLADVEGVVQAVGNRQAEVLLPAGDFGMQPGVRGWVKLDPVESVAYSGPVLPDLEADKGWKQGMPLLGGISQVKPQERPTVWSGKWAMTGRLSKDGTGSDRQDHYGQVGYSLLGKNPWGRGGRVDLDLELQESHLDFDSGVAGTQGESDLFLRARRASYAFGGDKDRPRRYQFGRFYSTSMPELGLLDGAEVSQRGADGMWLGSSFGWQPSYGPELQFEDSMAISGWVQKPLGASLRSSIAAAVQKTWFDGKADRDWMLFKGHYANQGPWSATANLIIDLYDSDDIAKDSGFETTEYRARVQRDLGPGKGVALLHSLVRFPEIRRRLPADYSAVRITGAETRRTGLSAWYPLSDERSLSGRYEVWSDEDENGGYTEVTMESELNETFADRWYVSGFVSDTRLADIAAVRLGLYGNAQGGRWNAGLDLGQYEQVQSDGTMETDFQGSLRGGWSGAVGRSWFLGLDAALQFGEERDAYSVGLLLQRSF
ncbi:MAG: hypothetical protein GY930_02925 [bacterium]|nr:hypothetical protein [bacterium]